ncbi:MAG: NTP transferase domain-containing protein, partial [Alphaproteobacteria bacterium]
MKTVIIIPSRLAAQRLPNKPLVDIGGKPMIVRVLERALAAEMGRVIVACCSESIRDVVHAAGGEAVMTDPALPSGTD